MTLYRPRLVVGESVQPRYILPLMPILLAVCSWWTGSPTAPCRCRGSRPW